MINKLNAFNYPLAQVTVARKNYFSQEWTAVGLAHRDMKFMIAAGKIFSAKTIIESEDKLLWLLWLTQTNIILTHNNPNDQRSI